MGNSTGISGFKIRCSPKIAVKSDVSDTPLDRRNRARFIKLVMIAGDKCIALLWRNADPLLVSMRLKNLLIHNVRKKNHLQFKKRNVFLINAGLV